MFISLHRSGIIDLLSTRLGSTRFALVSSSTDLSGSAVKRRKIPMALGGVWKRQQHANCLRSWESTFSPLTIYDRAEIFIKLFRTKRDRERERSLSWGAQVCWCAKTNLLESAAIWAFGKHHEGYLNLAKSIWIAINCEGWRDCKLLFYHHGQTDRHIAYISTRWKIHTYLTFISYNIYLILDYLSWFHKVRFNN